MSLLLLFKGSGGAGSSVAGVVASITVASPAGALGLAVSGPVAGVTLAGPAGSIPGTITAPAAAIAVAAPAGTLGAPLPGPTAAITLAAPAGAVPLVSGPTSIITAAAPAGGTSSHSVYGPVASITVGAPAGGVAIAVTAPSATIAVGAPTGAVQVTGIVAGPAAAAISVFAPAGTLGLGAPQQWTIEVWDKGANTLVRALAKPIFVAPGTKNKNASGSFSFKMGLYDPDTPSCDPKLGREIKLYRAGGLWESYRIWTDDVDFKASTVTFGCFSLLDYTRDRFIDTGAHRRDLGINSDFENGLNNWAATGTVATVITSDHVSGKQSVRLVQGSDDADAFLAQDIIYTAGGEGDLVTRVAWFKIVSWTGPALGNWGLTIKQTDMSGNVYDFQSSTIDYQTVRGKWIKAQVTTWVPPNETRILRTSLYSINGVIEWDATFMALMESLSLLQNDQAAIAQFIMLFLEDPTKYKDALNVTCSVPLTGVLRDRTYQYADHISGLQALTELTRLYDGIDIEITPTRVLKTYAILSGGIGRDRTAQVTLTFGTNANPTRRAFHGPSSASDVTALGNGGGPGREEGGAVDNSLFGGTTVQQVISPPSSDTPIDILAPFAQRQLAVFKDPTSFEVLVTDRDLGFTFGVGDQVKLAANNGYVQESGNARVVQVSADPVTDLVSLVLNRA